MIQINGMAHVGLRVTDFRRSAAFYRQFSFQVTREDYQEHVVVLSHASGVEINLLDSAVPNERNVLMDDSTKYPGYTHLALFVSDMDAVCRAIDAKGITITEGPVTFGDGKTSIFFRDPDLNVIELTTEEV
jgi:lactoylglutathione lyase